MAFSGRTQIPFTRKVESFGFLESKFQLWMSCGEGRGVSLTAGRRRAMDLDTPSRSSRCFSVPVSAQNGCRRDADFFVARVCLGAGPSDVSSQNRTPPALLEVS